MLRRVARVLRIGLLALGLALLMWLPFSFWYILRLSAPWPFGGSRITMHDGGVWARVESKQQIDFQAPLYPTPPTWGLEVTPIPPDWATADSLVLPRFERFGPGFINYVRQDGTTTRHLAYPGFVGIILPLWLLAAICLAWPVTSFILARRKLKRGFPVEQVKPDVVGLCAKRPD